MAEAKKYRKAALGGTFDRFHLGHRQLIQTALQAADQIVVGVTQPSLIQNKTLSNLIEPYEIRVKNVEQSLQNHKDLGQGMAVPLVDVYGPTLTDPEIDVIVVSTQTKPGGEQINRDRIVRGLPALPLVEAHMVSDETGQHISSTLIRQGHGTRFGRVYKTLFEKDIIFSKESLLKLKSPQGRLLRPQEITKDLLEQCVSVTLVGDVITSFFIEKQLPFNLSIIDGHTHRGKPTTSLIHSKQLINHNPPGTISQLLAEEIMAESHSLDSTILRVNGEEDLLAFVPVLQGPLGSAVFYGQPGMGVVMITLTEEVKRNLACLIDPTFK